MYFYNNFSLCFSQHNFKSSCYWICTAIRIFDFSDLSREVSFQLYSYDISIFECIFCESDVTELPENCYGTAKAFVFRANRANQVFRY